MECGAKTITLNLAVGGEHSWSLRGLVRRTGRGQIRMVLVQEGLALVRSCGLVITSVRASGQPAFFSVPDTDDPADARRTPPTCDRGNSVHGGRTAGGNSGFRGSSGFHSQPGTHSGAFSGFDHGRNVRSFYYRGRSSFGGCRGGGGRHR